MKLHRYSFLSLLLAICFAFTASHSVAQNNTGTIRGFVYLKKTGEPALFTNVYLQGTTIGATTDVNGYFSITHVAPGTYVLVATSVGYDTAHESVTVLKDQILTKKLYIADASIELGSVNISASEKSRQTDPNVNVTVITPQMMKQIPSIGGQPDIAQYLQVLPGVVSTGDQGGQLYIEGGQPIQNKVILDGMTIFNPFHSIGLFSVFDGDVISDATVYAGGFNAEYGDRVSSIMDIRTRDGNKKRVSGKVDVSPFGAHALVEGPLIKNTNDDPDKASSSFILSVKNSYIGQTSKALYPWIDSGHGIPFNFADYYGKVSLNTANGSKLNIFGFDYNDNVTYPNIDTVKWKEYGVGANFILVPGSSSSLMEGNIDFSNYSISDAQKDGLPRQSSINTFDLNLKFTSFMGNTNLYYGFDISGTQTAFNFYNSAKRFINDSLTSDELNGYVKLKITSKNKKLIVEPGFRVQYYATYNQISPEPRLDAKYNITDKFRFKFATGLYSQDLISIVDERDVVDLFYGISTAPPTADIPSQFTQQNGSTQAITSPLQRGYHLTGGFEYDPSNFIHINIEGYYKNFLQTSTLNYNKIYDDNADNYLIPDTLKKDFLVQSGKAYGADITIRYDYKELSLYGVYSLGYVEYWDGSYQFPPPFDRRHNVNLVASYTFGKDLSWMADVRFNYGSGFPFTPTQGYYPNVPFNNIGANYTTSNANLGTLYGTFDGSRLPDYARLDISLDKSFQLSENVGLHINASVVNLLDRQNIFYYDRLSGQRVNQLPILPTLSVAMTF
ncbi:MAG TPA: TonB-dependent receptor [Bacteroidia bacterium]|nr:TonB-dependent receptor [Bacteroidia bacterium]